jgi:phosphatidylglycerophosphate synthase
MTSSRSSVAADWTPVAFSRAHALAMLTASAAALATGSAWPATLIGAASLCAYVALHRERWTPTGRLGAANALTLLRLLAISALPLLVRPPGPAAALLVLAVFALDGVDGWLARRYRDASAFGAYFDMECDALLVLSCALVLDQSGRLPAFVLLPGLLRYAYVVLLWLWPARQPRTEARAEAPRSRIGRYAFALIVVSFIVSLWPLVPWHRPLAAVATASIVYSFGRSMYWSLASR